MRTATLLATPTPLIAGGYLNPLPKVEGIGAHGYLGGWVALLLEKYMATFAGNKTEDFKEEVLIYVEYMASEKGLTWGQVLQALVELVLYFMQWKKDEWRDPNGAATFHAGRDTWS